MQRQRKNSAPALLEGGLCVIWCVLVVLKLPCLDDKCRCPTLPPTIISAKQKGTLLTARLEKDWLCHTGLSYAVKNGLFLSGTPLHPWTPGIIFLWGVQRVQRSLDLIKEWSRYKDNRAETQGSKEQKYKKRVLFASYLSSFLDLGLVCNEFW